MELYCTELYSWSVDRHFLFCGSWRCGKKTVISSYLHCPILISLHIYVLFVLVSAMSYSQTYLSWATYGPVLIQYIQNVILWSDARTRCCTHIKQVSNLWWLKSATPFVHLCPRCKFSFTLFLQTCWCIIQSYTQSIICVPNKLNKLHKINVLNNHIKFLKERRYFSKAKLYD